MIRLLLGTLLLIGIQTARAEEPAQPSVDQPIEKSFFETRTLEDFQKLVHVDIKEMEDGAADLSSTVGG